MELWNIGKNDGKCEFEKVGANLFDHYSSIPSFQQLDVTKDLKYDLTLYFSKYPVDQAL